MIKKTFLFNGLFLLIVNFLSAQNLIPYKSSNGLWGYRNIRFNTIVIEPKFSSANDFSEGLAAVSTTSILTGPKYGFINEQGKLIVPTKYLYVSTFSEGLAAVRVQSGKVGYIDKTGKEVIPAMFDNANNFSEGLAAVMQNKKVGYIDKTGKVVIPFLYDGANPFLNQFAVVQLDKQYIQIDKFGNELPQITPYGYADRKAKKIVIPAKGYLSGNGFTADGIAIIRYYKEPLYGGINKNGETIIPFKYSSLRRLDNGLYCFWKSGFGDGIVNNQGRELINAKFNFIGNYTNKLAIAKYNNQFQLIDIAGNITTPLCSDFYAFEGNLARARLENKWGIINSDGKLIAPIKYESVDIMTGNIVKVTLNGKVGIIDENGRELLPIKYDDIGSFNDGCLRVKQSRLYGFIDSNFKELVPPKYEMAYWFSNGLAAVEANNMWGYINTKGVEIAPPKFQQVENCTEGRAAVKLNDKWGYINAFGKLIIPHKFNSAKQFNNGLAIIGQFGQYGFIDSLGKTVIPIKFNDANPFSENYASVKVNDKWGFINKKGTFIIEPQYQDADNFSENKVAVMKNNKWGYINIKNEEVISFKYGTVGSFSEGFAAVSMQDGLLPKMGYINQYEKQVTDFKFLRANPFINNKAYVTDINRREYYIDTTGNEIVYKKDIQAEQLHVAFVHEASNPNATKGKMNFAPKDKKLTGSFSIEYTHVSENDGPPRELVSNIKLTVTANSIHEYIWGKGAFVPWGNECSIVASDNITLSGYNGLAYVCSNGTLYFFYTEQGKNMVRVSNKNGSSHKTYISF